MTDSDPAPRIAPLDPPYEPAVAKRLESMVPPGVAPIALFRTVAHNPRVLDRFAAANLLDRGSISMHEREIVILRACARCRAEYEWGVHVRVFAEKAGIERAIADATVLAAADDPVWDDRERLLVRMVDELHDASEVSDELFTLLEKYWEPAQLIELVMLCGLYHTVSFLCRSFRVEHEPYAVRFPGVPDQAAPGA